MISVMCRFKDICNHEGLTAYKSLQVGNILKSISDSPNKTKGGKKVRFFFATFDFRIN